MLAATLQEWRRGSAHPYRAAIKYAAQEENAGRENGDRTQARLARE